MATSAQDALNEYKKGVKTGVEDFTPHRLIQMLMEGALDKISKAKGFMQQEGAQAIANKGEQISWAISIIDGLKVSLDKTVDGGGELVQNLEDLYIYMEKRLVEANLHNKIEYLDEVANLLREVKAGWDAVPQDLIQEHAKEAAKQSNDPAA
ncbi:MAG: flagellar export chaperone FliS [Gammaproteobacteria bacterium]|nr:flagellar export chaperone FliS [Gammaproteobacteria bacterium]